jgi:isocitrate dehydrogenase
MSKTPITVAYGDGIGPEIMAASINVLQAAGAQIEIEEIVVGEKIYLSGNTAGIEPSSWDSLRRTKVFYKAPLTTPQGTGFKSINVTTRKSLGLYANVRPAVSYSPFIKTKHPTMDLVIVRENEEDLYAGIEHRQTDEVYQCLKIITRPGSEKIVRYAFEYARRNNRKKVTAFTKDNIMKLTDGLFHKVFDEIGEEYPDLEKEHWIVDIGAAKMADTPEAFDVLVLPNLYGDVLSDVAAQIAGSVGLAGSANIGEHAAMFEAIHGSAPRRAGQNLANPSGLLLAGVMMMVHINQPQIAETVHNAWLRTVEEGTHTYDIFREGVSKTKVGTKEFGEAIIKNLGKQPETLKPVSYASSSGESSMPTGAIKLSSHKAVKETMGVDVFVHWDEAGRNPNVLGEAMAKLAGEGFELAMLSNRGQKVWPKGMPETFCVDHWRARYMSTQGPLKHSAIIALLNRVAEAGYDFVKTEHLCNFDGQPGYSLGQGQ